MKYTDTVDYKSIKDELRNTINQLNTLMDTTNEFFDYNIVKQQIVDLNMENIDGGRYEGDALDELLLMLISMNAMMTISMMSTTLFKEIDL